MHSLVSLFCRLNEKREQYFVPFVCIYMVSVVNSYQDIGPILDITAENSFTLAYLGFAKIDRKTLGIA